MCGTKEGDADEEDYKTSSEKEEPNIVQLFDLLPTCLLKVVLWTGRREVADEGTDQTDGCVDDGYVVAPSPCCFEVELGGNETAQGAPGDTDAELGPSNTNTSEQGISL